jgi:hypothetical protein
MRGAGATVVSLVAFATSTSFGCARPPPLVSVPTASSAAPGASSRARQAPAVDDIATAAKVRYPNELDGFRFFGAAPFRPLVPLTSTIADVRRVLGEPDEAVDNAHYGAPYPGDETAARPVFTYEHLVPGVRALVYFVRSDVRAAAVFPARLDGALLSVDLVSNDPIPFAGRVPEGIFRATKTSGADAGWIDYEDGTGLHYQVYIGKTRYGRTGPGDLNRIVYGASDAQRARARGEP